MSRSKVQKIFKTHPDFKEWIEGTELFVKIMQGLEMLRNKQVDYYRMEANGFSFNLIVADVKSAEDLPIEVIEEFYNNYPGQINLAKLIEDADNKYKS